MATAGNEDASCKRSSDAPADCRRTSTDMRVAAADPSPFAKTEPGCGRRAGAPSMVIAEDPLQYLPHTVARWDEPRHDHRDRYHGYASALSRVSHAPHALRSQFPSTDVWMRTGQWADPRPTATEHQDRSYYRRPETCPHPPSHPGARSFPRHCHRSHNERCLQSTLLSNDRTNTDDAVAATLRDDMSGFRSAVRAVQEPYTNRTDAPQSASVPYPRPSSTSSSTDAHERSSRQSLRTSPVDPIPLESLAHVFDEDVKNGSAIQTWLDVASEPNATPTARSYRYGSNAPSGTPDGSHVPSQQQQQADGSSIARDNDRAFKSTRVPEQMQPVNTNADFRNTNANTGPPAASAERLYANCQRVIGNIDEVLYSVSGLEAPSSSSWTDAANHNSAVARGQYFPANHNEANARPSAGSFPYHHPHNRFRQSYPAQATTRSFPDLSMGTLEVDSKATNGIEPSQEFLPPHLERPFPTHQADMSTCADPADEMHPAEEHAPSAGKETEWSAAGASAFISQVKADPGHVVVSSCDVKASVKKPTRASKPCAGRVDKTPKVAATDRTANGDIVKPLSAYNFFFAEERGRIVDGTDQQPRNLEPENVRKERLLWHHVNKDRKKRRIHRKTHGKIAFTTLSRVIGQRWRDLPAREKEFFRDVAKADLERYQQQLDMSRVQQGNV